MLDFDPRLSFEPQLQRYRDYWKRKFESSRWRFAGGFALTILAAFLLTRPGPTAGFILRILALLAFYLGVIICLRAPGLMVTDHEIERLHKRQIAGVFAAIVIAVGCVALIPFVIRRRDSQKGEPSW